MQRLLGGLVVYPLRGTQLVTEIWRLTSWILLSVSWLKSTSIRFHRQCFPLVLENLQLSGFVGKLFSRSCWRTSKKVAPSDIRDYTQFIFMPMCSKRKHPSSKLWSFKSQLNANGPVMNVHNNKWIPNRSPDWSMCLPVNRTGSIGFPLLKRALSRAIRFTSPEYWNTHSLFLCPQQT